MDDDMIAFESWAEAEGHMDAEDAKLWRNEFGYEEPFIDHMWMGWKARAEYRLGHYPNDR